MKMLGLIGRGLRFYWRTHLGVLLGAAVATAVLVGALAVGDSIQMSLQRLAVLRLGDVEVALNSGGRFFRQSLAAELAGGLRVPAAPVLQLRGIVGDAAGALQANGVQVLGVDGRFWQVGGAEAVDLKADETVALNSHLAERLGVAAGDEVFLRVEKPDELSKDAPLSGEGKDSVAARLTVAAVLSDEQFGRFGLAANQVAPLNAFVPIGWLAERLDLAGRANTLLVARAAGRPIDLAAAQDALERLWSLDDAQLELRELPERGVLELRTSRIFLDPPAIEAAKAAAKDAVGAMTYLVNEFRHLPSGKSTPYSFAAALEPNPPGAVGRPISPVAPDMADDEILVNAWLAEDLGAKKGDELELEYYVVGPKRSLLVRSRRFRVRGVVAVGCPGGDRDLMPQFPGLAGAEKCTDWAPGVDIDTKKFRGKDEQYWKTHGGAPKAFVTLKAGQEMWASRFGDHTAVRWPLATAQRGPTEEGLRRKLKPASIGLFFQPVRANALAAGEQAGYFGMTFLGLSFFLIAAALLLMALLFVFGVEHRAGEVGALLAVGFRPGRVRLLLLGEGGALAVLGAVLGAAAGLGYTHLLLWGLATVWRGVSGGAPIAFHAEASTVLAGAASGVGCALAAICIVLWRQGRKPARQLLAEGIAPPPSAPRAGRRPVSLYVAGAALAGAAAIVASVGARRDPNAMIAFLGVGALLLTAGLASSWWLLGRLALRGRAGALSLRGLGLRNSAKRRGRSLAIIGMLGSGVFMVAAISAHRKDPLEGADRPASGTGGYTFYAESTLPVVVDLTGPKAPKTYKRLRQVDLTGVTITALRTREGDAANCLNLNRPQQPRLLGVRSAELAGRFTIESTLAKDVPANPWLLLDRTEPDGAIPAFGDSAMVAWSLRVPLGHTLAYTDERGRPLKVRIVGTLALSILQGGLLISERHFADRFPSEAGYRTFLVQAGRAAPEELRRGLSAALQDVGMDLASARLRLRELTAIEGAYLTIFEALGGLGVLLGSVGMGVVVLRNVLERRGELALMRAVGFGKGKLQWLLLCEHWWLLGLGLGCGVVSALVAAVPSLRTPGAGVPVGSLAVTLLAVAASGAVWTYLATALALRGELLVALRNE